MSKLKLIYIFLKLYIAKFKQTHLYQFFPKKPEVLNFNAVDHCNSKCAMCNIWKNEDETFISIKSLEEVLQDPLYLNIKHVGVTGGEPTLRDDLLDIFKAFHKKLPKLEGMSMITNSILGEDVYEKIEKVDSYCKDNNLGFSVMLSLDGVGKTHEKVRGIENNFEKVNYVLDKLISNQKISFSTGSTISSLNVWEIDDVLNFLNERNIYGRFRVAEFIKRLYNEDLKTIRNFDADETYHLMLFFKKLELQYEKSENIKRTYRSIVNVLGGGDRKIGCPYKYKGMVLNSAGNISYCAPKSDILSSSKENHWGIFKGKISERRQILKKYCNKCIHDYHEDITYKEYLEEHKQDFWTSYLSFFTRKKLFMIFPFLIRSYFSKVNGTVSIVGHYGTETVGDKAILGAVYDSLSSKEQQNLTIFSLYPFVTKKTIKELKINAKVEPYFSFTFFKIISQSEKIIIGGGPLMDSYNLPYMHWAFKIGRLFNRQNIIYHCGIGPINKERSKFIISDLIVDADTAIFRDKQSANEALKLSPQSIVKYETDPATKYILQFQDKGIPKQNIISCFMREWTQEYKAIDETESEFNRKKIQFEYSSANYLKQLSKKYNFKLVFYPMHSFCVGNDDREFLRKFANQYFSDQNVIVFNKIPTVASVCKQMSISSLNICMRFHSTVFADTLDANYMSIDYTRGGKILNFLSQKNKLDRLISIDELIKNYY